MSDAGKGDRDREAYREGRARVFGGTFTPTDCSHLEPGDRVTRWLSGVIPMRLVVSEVKEDRVVCGAWQFDRTTGAEIDEELGWAGKVTGSFIVQGGVA